MDPLGHIQAKKIINRIFIFDLLFFAATAIVSIILGSVFSGKKGLWGAIVAVIVLLVFALFTPLAFKILSRKKINPRKFVLFVTGSWFLKLIIVFAALIILSRFTFFDRGVFAWTVFAGAVGVLGIEGLTVFLTGLPKAEERKEETDE
ncbi:MAG: hypothetical protein II014_01010 [Bifidobacteriaceae bacterium]|nr:hypothetical protein [Aeriscardovia sp.]MBQ1803837.1 hypothetical protein [Bifidobacteriaceae bacterium]